MTTVLTDDIVRGIAEGDYSYADPVPELLAQEVQKLRHQLEEKTREVERQRRDAEKASELIGRAQPWFREALAIVVDAPEFEGGCETQARLRNLIEDAMAPLVEARWTLETMAPVAGKDPQP